MPSIKIVSAKASMKHAELSGIVTIGEETAARLNKKNKGTFKAGDQINLGTIALYDENPLKSWWANFLIGRRRSILS